MKTRAPTQLFAVATVIVALACVSKPQVRGETAAIAALGATGTSQKRMSDSGLARIRGHEAYKGRSYDDGAGNMTIGYGHLIRAGENFSAGLTEAQADSLFRADVERVVNPAFDRITIELNQNQIDALGSFIFNVGTGGFVKSILSHVNAGEIEGTTSRMLQFITGRDVNSGARKVLRGLVTRRQTEVALFKNPVPLQYLRNLISRS
jgi:GH24 family phage-related lysozyme (muramidase)